LGLEWLGEALPWRVPVRGFTLCWRT